MVNDLYYNHPVQVRFWDAGRKMFLGGVAFRDYVICGCCGKVCLIRDIVDEANLLDNINEDDAIVELAWNNIDKAIRQ